MLSMIVAHDENRAIGRAGGMPWHIPEDLKYFRQVTLGKPIIMGRGTWGSIGSKPLPGRRNIVVTRQPSAMEHSGAEFVSLGQALEIVGGSDTEIFCIGGGQLYAQMITCAVKLIITRIETSAADADTWFPEYSENEWVRVSELELCTIPLRAIACEYRRKPL